MTDSTYHFLLAAAMLVLVVWIIRRRESFDAIDDDDTTAQYTTEAFPFSTLSESDLLKEEDDFLEKRKKINQSFGDGSLLLPDEVNPNVPDLTKGNFLTAGYHVGIDTRPQTKVKNLDIRSLPTIPRSSTDNPWFNETSFDADFPRKRLE